MGLNLSSSYLLFSIFVKLKLSCIPKAFTGAQIQLNELMPRGWLCQLQQRNSWAQDTQGCALVLPGELCGSLCVGAETRESWDLPFVMRTSSEWAFSYPSRTGWTLSSIPTQTILWFISLSAKGVQLVWPQTIVFSHWILSSWWKIQLYILYGN